MSSKRTPCEEVAAPGKFPFVKVGIVLAIGVALIIGALSLEETRKNRAQMKCVGNLKQIDSTAQAWALDNWKALTDTYSLSDTAILACMKGSMLPVCPLGGVYSPGTNHGDVPRCSIPSHALLFPTPMGGYPR
jgi:hypothetical protein